MIGLLVLFTMIGLLLGLQAVLGISAWGPTGAFIFLQAVYMAIAWLVRPLVLLLAQPAPRRGDPIADSRFAPLGYGQILSTLLPLAAIGLASTLVVYFGFRRRISSWGSKSRDPMDGLIVIWLSGWVFRALSLVSPASGLLDTLSLLSAVAVGACILYVKTEATRARWVILAVVVGGEFVWSVASASKAPILACVLWLIMREFTRSRFQFWRMAVLSICGVVAFIVIQEVKVDKGALTSNDSFEEAYPLFIRPILYLVRRFDHLSALGDAYFAGQGRWMTLREAVVQLFSGLIPQQILENKGDNIGARWANEVRAYSVPNSNTGVHLAEGPIAEGYLLSGTAGIILESVVLALISLWVCRCIVRGALYGRFFGLALTTQPMLFERGILGVGEGIGKSIQVALICTLISALLSFFASGRAPGRPWMRRSLTVEGDRGQCIPLALRE